MLSFIDEWNGNKIIPVEGKSLTSTFSGGKLKERTLYWDHGSRAIREKQWKLVSKKNSKWELYNIEKDRTELSDLSSEYPDLVEILSKKWKQWAVRVNVFPKP